MLKFPGPIVYLFKRDFSPERVGKQLKEKVGIVGVQIPAAATLNIGSIYPTIRKEEIYDYNRNDPYRLTPCC